MHSVARKKLEMSRLQLAMGGESLPHAPIPFTTQEKSEQARSSPLRSGISATPSPRACRPKTRHAPVLLQSRFQLYLPVARKNPALFASPPRPR